VSPPSRRVRAAAWILTRSRVPAPAVAWARRILLARTPSLGELPIREFAEILRAGSEAQRACVLGWSPPGTTAQQVLAAVDRPGLVGPAAILLAHMPLQTGALSTTLFNVIALDSAGEPDRTQAALLAVRRAPERMLAPQRHAIFTRAWRLAAQPVNPYAPIAFHDAARSAAAALLATHADLRPGALADISDPSARQLRLVYAAGLQGASDSLADAVGEAFATMKPSEQAALAFARNCDRDFSAADPLVLQGRGVWRARASRLLERRRSLRLWRWLPPAACLLGAPAAGAGLALVVNAVHHIRYHMTLSSGTIVAIAAVLVAIHVVASELAAERLPGMVARATSVPLPLWAGYGSVIFLYVVAIWQPDRYAAHTREVLAIGVIGALAVSFALSLWRLLSRTDNTVAARIFASGEVRRAVRSGRAVGRMNAAVLQARSDTAALMWVRSEITAPLSVRRAPILSTAEGYLVLRLRVLRRLDRGNWWHGGARLWLTAVPGTLVHQGDEIGSIVPSANEVPSERTRREAHRLFTVRQLSDAEHTGEAISALVELTTRLAEAGNEPGASRVARRAVDVLHAHLRELEHARGPLPDGGIGAPVGVARTAALALSRALARADDPASREVLTGLAQRALPGCTQGDSFLAVLIGQVATFGDGEGDPELAERLLWDCGRRTVELADPVITRLWWESVARLARNQARHESVLTMAGRVVQYASVVNSPGTERAWERLQRALDPARPRDQAIIVRVGGSALLVGHVSLALVVARSLPEDAWPRAEARNQDPAMLEYETVSDQIHGHLLGPQADVTLGDFVRFGKAVAEHVS
jgi:hypothetical protein